MSKCSSKSKTLLFTSGQLPIDPATKFMPEDIKDFPAVNEVYATFFSQPFPAKSCFAVKELPLGARIEIEAVALTR
jgi:2-iminobutanoate/2-iminopropanoate deaminase